MNRVLRGAGCQPTDSAGHGAPQAQSDSGVYALLIRARTGRRIAIGALGSYLFPRGLYVYIGSAKRGLRSRIARHRGRKKRLHWHIDYLLRHGQPVAVATFPWRRGAECRLARRAAEHGTAQGLVNGFGSSDCRCPTHLFRLPTRPLLGWVEHVFGPLPQTLAVQALGPRR
jgi:sugar fermentation stimulation protein A